MDKFRSDARGKRDFDDEAMALPMHRKRQEGDEYYCPRCRKRWDVHEEAPPCQND